MIQLPVCMDEMKNSSSTFFIELYVINLKTGILRIAACDENIIFDGEEYIAVPVQRQSITKSMDNIIDSCTLTVSDVDEKLLGYVLNGYDFRSCYATAFRIQYPDSLSDPSISEWMFSGLLDEPTFSDGTFSCKIQSIFPQIDCPNRSYQLACNSEFGDESCGVSLATEVVNIRSTANEGNVLILGKSFTENYWQFGVAVVEGESRIIEKSNGNTVTLNVNFLQSNVAGKSVHLSRGCNKSQECCRKYDNLKRYSGFPAIPFESIYR